MLSARKRTVTTATTSPIAAPPASAEADAEERAVARPGADRRRERAHQHHAFEADGEHASALGQDAAERRQQQRRRDADGGGEEVDHVRRTVAARTNSIVRPSITTTSAEGTPI